ncbi:unnamed protein product [Rotaria sordida]|uniref:Uncharacterized protein n=1 Tax=Rotaria sordida TaxID=392033 RepID=A0A814TG85_9BILA|nr:unnamed protein product [Rotaria sordida]
MGNRSVRTQGDNLATYGASYDPYYGYEGMENYGSIYQPTAGEYPFGYGITDELLMTTLGSPLGGPCVLGPQGLGAYGYMYSASFNPMLEPGLSRSKVRLIYIPNYAVAEFQNLFQQGSASFANPFVGGYGGFGIPQMMPQIPMLQGSMFQMGSNCWSMSFQLPSMGPQFSFGIPCPPPMIQPVMSQMPMSYPMVMPQMLSIATPSMPYSSQAVPMVPQQIAYPPQFPIIPQQQICPQSIPGNFGGVPSYGGFGQGLPLGGSFNNYAAFSSIGGNILSNFSGIDQPGFGQSAFAAYGGFGQLPYGGFSQPGFGQSALAAYGGFGQLPYGGFSQPGFGQSALAAYGGSGQLPYGGFSQPGFGQSAFAVYGDFGQLPYDGFSQPGFGQSAFAAYGGFSQPRFGQSAFAAYGDFGQLPYGGFSQPGFGQSAFAAYGGFGQLPYGGFSQPGFGGLNQLSYSGYGQPGFARYGQYESLSYYQPGFASYSQQPFGNVNQLGFGGFSQAQPQFGGIYPQQLSYNAFPQQSFSYYPGANINLSSGLPLCNSLFQPGIFPTASNFSPISHAQLGSFSGGSGRITILFSTFILIFILLSITTKLSIKSINRTMVRLFHFIFVMLIGLSIVIAKNDIKFRNIQQKRFSRSNEHTHTLHGQKQQGTQWNGGETTVESLSPSPPPSPEEIACLAACQYCVEDYPIESSKQKTANNCGPMCDCADSCFHMSVQQVGKLYGQNAKTDYGKECWWRTYTEMLGNVLFSA